MYPKKKKLKKMKFYSLCFCLFLLLNFSPSFQQSCEEVENPTDRSSCVGKTTLSDSETCCYSKYSDSDGNGTECIEIKSEDAASNDKLESALDSILSGEYWSDYTYTYYSLTVQCENSTATVQCDDDCSSRFLKGIFVALFAFFLL